MRALVIDDSRPVRSILTRLLRELHFETDEACNGCEALQWIDQHGRPDLATLNWNMPEMDGLAFLQRVRTRPNCRDLPIVMVTMESAPARVAQAQAAGATAYVIKPFTRETIEGVLRGLGLLVDKSNDPPSDEQALRVLVVDDAAVVRRLVSVALEEARMSVATARDGLEAIDYLSDHAVDAVLLDIEMPRMDGFGALQEIRRRWPRLPVLMFSSLTERGAAATMKALELGASDYVLKPGGTHMRDAQSGMDALREQVIPRLHALTRRRRVMPAAVGETPAPREKTVSSIDVVVIASSTGGPNALVELLPCFAPSCPVPIAIVQHMPAVFTTHLAQRLARLGTFGVREISDGEPFDTTCVCLARGGQHFALERERRRVVCRTTDAPPINGCRPSADVLFDSAVDCFGGGVLGVVLTGMGNDGLAGCRKIYHAGGQVLVQDEASSVVWGMPGAVAQQRLADRILPLQQLGGEIQRRVWKRGQS